MRSDSHRGLSPQIVLKSTVCVEVSSLFRGFHCALHRKSHWPQGLGASV